MSVLSRGILVTTEFYDKDLGPNITLGSWVVPSEDPTADYFRTVLDEDTACGVTHREFVRMH